MGLLPFWSFSRYVRCLSLLLSVLVLLSVLCTGPVSAETGGVDLSRMSAVYVIGDEITLRGDTNLAPGTIFLITVEEEAFRPTEKGDAGAFSGTSGTGVVQAGPPPFWSFSFGTAGWAAGEYRFTVEVPKTGTVQSGTFFLLAVEEMPDTPVLRSPVPSHADIPGPSPSSAVRPPSPTAVPLSPGAVVAGIAAIYLFRSYFLD